MIYDIKDFLKRFFKSRLFVLSTVMVLMFSTILLRIFNLQVVNGQMYQDKFVMKIEKTMAVDATRGNIYDVNGKVLAYNELARSIVISDSGKYDDNDEKNKVLGEQLAKIVQKLAENGEKIYTNSFGITYNEDGSYSYNLTGTRLRRFIADVFGRASFDKLEYNEKYGFNEATATAEQVVTYLRGTYGLGEEYDDKTAFEIATIRYAMNSTRYSRYNTITIAEDVGDKTVAYINEHLDTMIGVEIRETTIRRYNDSYYFASILGYTGKISETEYEKLSASDKSYSRDDVIGKAGLEQYYEAYLRGTNGEQLVYVDTVGRIQQIVSYKEPVAGNDLYLSIDSELQKSTYLLLEQELAAIVYSSIRGGVIPIKDVYFALLDNNVIDLTKFDDEDASETAKTVYASYKEKEALIFAEMKEQLFSSNPKTNNQMSEELLDYFTYMFSLLKSEDVLLSSRIDTSDSVYIKWRQGNISPKEYLMHCITMQWLDISLLDVDSKYADTSEIYNAICNLAFEDAAKDKNFAKIAYKYLIDQNTVTGKQLSILLFDQGIIDYNEDSYNRLVNNRLSSYDFILDKINNIEITPAQLALDPCTASCIITDTKTGEIRALVSYPGYDNNKLANGVDSKYYALLTDDKSNPLWNCATQEKTAPGSTFKLLSATAGLAEGVITLDEHIECTGIYEEVDNKPKCHIYSSGLTHGQEDLSKAILDSCNIYFYDTGYRLSTKDTGIYNDASGIAYIKEYASIFGLDKKSGLEIAESLSSVATEYPVMAAIGQSNNNYTTSALSRYVTAVATGKLYNYQLMNKIVDTNGKVVAQYNQQYEDISSTLSDENWSQIRYGMNLVGENYSALQNFPLNIAGKSGTAQQVSNRPNHGLFIAYAPYEEPEISITTRIAYGHAAYNAAQATKNILSVYFELQTLDEILALKAAGINVSISNVITD